MEIKDLSVELDIAKKAAIESGKLLLHNKIELNKSLKVIQKDTKLLADVESENLIKEIIVTKSQYPI